MFEKQYAGFDAPDLAPVIACEHTEFGWRGLTGDGEVLNVNAHVNGKPAEIPGSIAISRKGEIIGYRAVPRQTNSGVIDRYTHHLAAATSLTRINQNHEALAEIDGALVCANTMLARYNRSMILLALGRWQEGLDEFAYCEQNSPLFMRPQYANAIEHGLELWRGQDIASKRLLLIHDHGFGDSIMMLRYVAQLRAMGAEVVLQMPPELERLAAQIAPVTRDLVEADYVCSMLFLAQVLRVTPETIPLDPYLRVEPELVEKWKHCTGTRKIGIAWSVGHIHGDDYPRSAPLGLLRAALGDNLISVQQQAEPDMLGVAHYPFEDFADCAALMSLLDEIVSVDTAAVHLAGAIGHPNISLLLSHWASWRWQSPLYRNLRICQQDSAGDWESAFAKRA